MAGNVREKCLRNFKRKKTNNTPPLKMKMSFTGQEQEHAASLQCTALLFLSHTAPSVPPIHPALLRTWTHTACLMEVFVAPVFQEKYQEKLTESIFYISSHQHSCPLKRQPDLTESGFHSEKYIQSPHSACQE